MKNIVKIFIIPSWSATIVVIFNVKFYPCTNSRYSVFLIKYMLLKSIVKQQLINYNIWHQNADYVHIN